jgi:hypothetical protein
MPTYQHDMSKVDKWGDIANEGWYRVRVDKGVEKPSDNSPGELVWWLYLKVQNEPHVGKLIMDNCSLQAHALAKLKGYYEATGYIPGPEGHDPERLNGTELFIKVEHETYKGEKRAKIAPYNIKSLQEGPKGAMAA